ncbi:glutamate 5-kinase [Paucilactobacillus suebicus]|uniref:Glutamate 5-kinase n=1 Tax=Paucilactobacillus suebicus DSM 5007 = KCTC 3549 TaxID=1423807 RepID=A0A0R1W2Q8_9LACO|nr:glutamate 5-kinase [Paucilactobacillus suebicus]KRM12129.1 gamma-glutamyl kinase [Paucilactobacillus suebicus DSM 5007 = KCTC 3549]
MSQRPNFLDPKRLVVKIGTSSLIYPDGQLNLRTMDELAFVLSAVRKKGREVVLVSSGAIGVGLNQMHLKKRPADIASQQAIASIGQNELMAIFNQRFASYGQQIGQVLLTHDVMDYPHSRENVLNTFDQLMNMNAIPIVNENDTVAVDELDHKTTFGDNDQLSAIVATSLDADLLIVLSDIDALFNADPHVDDDAHPLPYVDEITPAIIEAAGGSGTRFGTGGMVTKLKAAQRVMSAGHQMVLANGTDPKIIFDILAGKSVGTLFAPTLKRED